MLPEGEWERVRPWIQAALEYAGGTHTIEDVLAAIEAERAFLLVGERSALVCEIETFPRMKVLHIWLAGGDLEELRSLNDQMDDMARTLGCSRVTISGRKGWERALYDLDYRPMYFTVAKDIA